MAFLVFLADSSFLSTIWARCRSASRNREVRQARSGGILVFRRSRTGEKPDSLLAGTVFLPESRKEAKPSLSVPSSSATRDVRNSSFLRQHPGTHVIQAWTTLFYPIVTRSSLRARETAREEPSRKRDGINPGLGAGSPETELRVVIEPRGVFLLRDTTGRAADLTPAAAARLWWSQGA